MPAPTAQLPLVTVVGVGALGSHVVLFGRALPVRWRVIDFDRVESKNVAAQFHPRTMVGRNKAQSLAQTMHGMFGGMMIEPIPHKLVADNAEQLLGGSALAVDCLDNAEARTLVQSWVRKHDVPCIHGALAADGAMGRAVWDGHFVIDAAGTGAATCEGGEHLPFIGMTATLITRAIQMWLRDGKQVDVQAQGITAVRL